MIVAKLDEVGMKLKKKLCEMEIIPGCFVAGTLIKMKGGGYKRIEDIEIGDYVLSYNEDEQTEEYQKVYKTFKNTVSTTLEIKFKNGISVETTLNHLFYLKDTGYVEAWKLEKNNKIFSINKYEEIEEIYEKEYFVKDIYNFSVKRNNNYYISELDLLVHNEGESCAEILKKMDGAIKNKNDIYKGTKKSLRKEEYEEIMNACFIDGTKVFSKDNLKIDEIEKGDFVYSYNFEKEKIEEKEVLTIFKSRVDRIIKLTLKNIGTNLIEDIETTLEHLFYTNGNYKLAKYLKVGDELKSFNNETVEIMNVETKKLEKEIFVYNIEVKDNHNYFVGGNKILVHNKKTRYTRTEKIKTDKNGNILYNKKGKPKKEYEYKIIDGDGNVKVSKKFPKELKIKDKPRTTEFNRHLSNGGEIAIGDGKLKLGLPNTDKLTDIVDRKGKIIEYSKLNGGYYICDYSDGLGSFSDHSIAIYTTDTSKFKGNTRDFSVFDEDIQKANPDRFSSRAEVEDYRNKNGLTLHHEDDGFDVIDYVLHKYFSHDGEASVQRKN
jgi:intein C-terminal splicing region domain protein